MEDNLSCLHAGLPSSQVSYHLLKSEQRNGREVMVLRENPLLWIPETEKRKSNCSNLSLVIEKDHQKRLKFHAYIWLSIKTYGLLKGKY